MPPVRINRSYSVKHKLCVVKWHYENGGSVSATAWQWNVDRKRVRDWLASEEKPLMNRRGSNASKKRIGMNIFQIPVVVTYKIY